MTQYVSPGHTFVLKGTLAQDGTLVAEAGTAHKPGAAVLVRGGATNLGTITLDSGNSAAAAGTSLMVSGTLNNAGMVYLAGGIGPNGAGATLSDSGVLLNRGDLIIGNGGYFAPEGQSNAPGHGATALVTGMLSNTGTITVNPYAKHNGALYHGGGGGVLAVAAGATLDNAGLLSVDGGGVYAFDNPLSNGTVTVAGVLNNSGVIDLQTATDYIIHGDAGQMLVSGTLTNTGVIDIGTGGGTAYFIVYGYGSGATLDLTGSLVSSGTIDVLGGSTRNSQYGGPGVLLDNGTLTNSGNMIIGANYSAPYASTGALLDVTGAMSNSGRITLQSHLGKGFGGQINDSGVLTNTGVIYAQGAGLAYAVESIAAALIDVSGVLTNNGSIGLQGGLPAEPGYYGYPGKASPGAQLIDSGTLTNRGVITVNGGRAYQGSSALGLAAALTVTTTGVVTDTGSIIGGGTLVNYGVIGSGHGATTGLIDVAVLINDGAIEVAPAGAFVVDSAVTSDAGQYGGFELSQQSTLTLGDAISASQTVSFLGNHATLTLGSAVAFAGTLDGLGPQDTIDFKALTVVSASTSGMMLDIGLAGGTMLDLALGAPLTGVAFALAGDGSGGTDVVLRAMPSATPHSSATTPPGISYASMDSGFSARAGSEMNAALQLHPSNA